ncbi:MAG: hypothetical protein BCS36_06285 [Desulfovibrio sp. MES5]|uniref:outer membrane protein assembly factor BamE domain-containing protein n=1 Tax=Desulfovibrio sp. MES5 TaxID=1899016 RepID=UPI000B9CD01E|nr:outer membrane protein assembly factor BamE [Desulfovibrio sp. MES5]OXS29731.1 MAG: hypothetical protein BCS36_06285 [Desulfovibrio sp. MES5]
MKKVLLVFLVALTLAGCASAQKHRSDVRDDSGEKLSVAAVQREIRVGMSGAEVVSVLGAPNMVTTDAQRRETWVYDKVATESAKSSSSGGLWLILAGVSGSSSASSTSQRTLTIIIKFDNDGKVRDYSYRQSSF